MSRNEDVGSARPDTASQLTIQQVSRLLDVPAPTIRSWERRYGVPQANRSIGGHRRYSDEQVRGLRRMRDAISRGQPAAEAAILAKTVQLRAQEASPLIDGLLAAALRLDPRAVTASLEAAHAALGLDAAVDDVLFPALRRIGRDWESGRCDVAHEHLAAEAARNWLTRMPEVPRSDGRRPGPVLMTGGPDDHHILGLEALAALLRLRGSDVRVLGVRTPAESVVFTIKEMGPAALVLVSHLPVNRRSAVHALRLAAECAVPIFYAGAAFETSQARANVPGTYLGDSVTAAADTLAAALAQAPDAPLSP